MKRVIVSQMSAAVLALGLLSACDRDVKSVSTDFNSLPLAVQKTVRAQDPDAEIASIQRANRDGVDLYEVTLRKDGQSPTITVAPDGRLLSTETVTQAGKVERLLTPTGAGTPISALPLDVQRAVKRQAEDRMISNVTRDEKNGVVIYTVEFAGPGENTKLRVREDGEVVP